MTEWAADETKPSEVLEFDQYGLHATLRVKTMRALYYKAGKERLLMIVLVQDTEGGRPDQMFYGTRLDWDARRFCRITRRAGVWRSCTRTPSRCWA